MSEHVKRRYDATLRRERAEATRGAVLTEARRQFLAQGYASTSIASIAAGAGVSVETIYKSFGPKAALVRALWNQSLEGQGSVPAEERSDALGQRAADAASLVEGWATLVGEVSPVASPLALLVKQAAAHDEEMAALLAQIDAERRVRMRVNAKRLLAHRGVRGDLTVASATDVLWLYSSAEMYELMVLRSGMSARKYRDFVGAAFRRLLLDPQP